MRLELVIGLIIAVVVGGAAYVGTIVPSAKWSIFPVLVVALLPTIGVAGYIYRCRLRRLSTTQSKSDVGYPKKLAGAVIILLIGVILWRTRNIAELQSSPVSVDKLPRVLGPALAVLLVLTVPAQRLWRFYTRGPMLLCGLSVILMCASAAWSSMPGFTLFKAAEFAAGYLAVGLFAVARDPWRTSHVLGRIVVGYMIILVASAWLGLFLLDDPALRPTRSSVLPYQLQGVVPVVNPNSLGIMAALVLVYGICIRSISGRVRWVIGIVAIVTMIAAQSRTSWIICVASIACVAVAQKRRNLRLAVVALGASLVGSASFQWLVQSYMQRGVPSAHLETLSGRTDMWEYGLKVFSRNPYFGSGYAAAARLDAVVGEANLPGASAMHNAWVDLLVGVGVVGAIPFFVAIIWSLIRLFRMAKVAVRGNDDFMFWFAGLFALLISTATSTAFAYHSHSSVIVLIAIASASRGLRDACRASDQLARPCEFTAVPIGAKMGPSRNPVTTRLGLA